MNSPHRVRAAIADDRATKQLRKLEAVIGAAFAAMPEASRGMLFASAAGKAFVNSLFDLTECDDLYRLAQDINHELGIEQ